MKNCPFNILTKEHESNFSRTDISKTLYISSSEMEILKIKCLCLSLNLFSDGLMTGGEGEEQ